MKKCVLLQPPDIKWGYLMSPHFPNYIWFGNQLWALGRKEKAGSTAYYNLIDCSAPPLADFRSEIRF
jgi:hypothetical protein